MTGPAGKPRTEAQGIIIRLQFAGMKRAEIAKQLGVSAETVKAIAAGRSSGDTYLLQLRGMQRYAPAAPAAPRPTGLPTGEPPAAPPPSPIAPGPGAAATPAIDAAEAPKDERTAAQRFRDGLKAGLTGRASDAARADLSTVVRRSGKSGGDQAGSANETLTEQLTPLLALAAVILSQLLIPERYSAVGPEHEEASAILKPLVRLMTRQLEVAGALTEAQLDILASLAALGLYADRAWKTYKRIRAEEARTVDEFPGGRRPQPGPARYEQQHGPGGFAPAAAHPEPMHGAPAPGVPHPFPGGSPFGGGQAPGVAAQHFIAAPAPGGQGGGDVRGNGAGGVGQGTDPFASLYALDALGRRQLGIN